MLYTAVQLAEMKKTVLLAIATENKPVKKYKVNELLASWNTEHGTEIRLNILPIAHPRLNPIEMIWAWLKPSVAKDNKVFTMEAVKDLIEARQIVFHCIDDDMMDIDVETMFRSSVGDLMLWIVRLVSFEKLTL